MKQLIVTFLFVAVIIVFIMLLSKKKTNKPGLAKFRSFKPKMIPSADKRGSGRWARPVLSSLACKIGMSNVAKNDCQNNPGTSYETCSDYPYVFCDDGQSVGKLQSMGDPNSSCPYDGSIAYDVADCDSPRKTSESGSILCGGSTGHPCSAENCTDTGEIFPPDNPWNATGSC